MSGSSKSAGAADAFALLALAALLVLIGPEQQALRIAMICSAAILCFATRALPEILTAVLCFLGFLAIDAAPAGIIFSGFATGGFWLLFSGLIIGAAIGESGLGRQIAMRIFARTGGSYARAVFLLCTVGLGLGVLVPSTMPRIIMMMPVAVSLATTMGFTTGSRGQIGLAMAAATSTLLPTYTILTANLPTIVHYGALETLYVLAPSYAQYFIYQLPVNIVRFAVLLILLVPFARQENRANAETETPGPMTPHQWRLLLLLCGAIGLWATDSLHGISPAWIALAVAAIVLWPASGLLSGNAMKTSVDLSPAVFLAGVFAVSAVARHIGLDALVADALIPRMALSEGSSLYRLYAITGFSVLISHLTTAPAAPIVLAPLAEAIGTAANWPIRAVAMAQIIGISTPVLPYQAPPLIVAMALAHMPVASLTRVCLLLTLGVAAVGIPVTFLWWRAIGLI